jgi:hypothetical protein
VDQLEATRDMGDKFNLIVKKIDSIVDDQYAIRSKIVLIDDSVK